MKNKDVLLYFPEYRDYHFHKDVGQIPYAISRKFNSKFFLLTRFKEEISMNSNVELLFYKKSLLRGFIFFLSLCRVNPHVTILFFLNTSTLILAILARTFSRSIVYVKGDINLDYFKDKINNSYFFMHKMRAIFYLFDVLNIKYSVETSGAYDFLKYNFKADNLIYLPNGVSKDFIDNGLNVKREDIIITVGRLGTKSKNTQLTLQIAKDLLENDVDGKWVFYLVGPIEDETNFILFRNTFFLDNPHLVDRIIFTGNITDRCDLHNLYLKSKIFLLNSRYEGSPMVLLEATINGLVLACAENIHSFPDITNNGSLGFSFSNNDKSIGKKLLDFINTNDLESLSFEQSSFTIKHYIWGNIVDNLYNKLI